MGCNQCGYLIIVGSMDVRIIRSTLQNLADKKQAQIHQRFFKTGPGEYGQGDIFLGIRVPQLRRLSKED